ncbi:MAG: hypothetical protein GY795_36935 [Desulfobacterales bacterium]|nr:hypothetical protein [Desulfobacterales bacterium]
MYWSRGRHHRIVAWELYYEDEKPNCLCNPCWKYLKEALGDSLPSKNITIFRRIDKTNATEAKDYVSINENVSVTFPELGANGNLVFNVAPFEIILWHEAIGHGYRDLDHPSKPWNHRGGGGGPDPTIQEENNARNCLRLQGIQINDRVPEYYGW